MKNQYDVFISYRREGGIDTARTFYDRLSALGYRVSFDIETLRNGKFNEQLYNRIDECKDVIVILNRTALELRENPDDDWLRLEVAHALKAGRNIVAVFLRDFVRPKPGTLPPDIADLLDYQGVISSDEHFDSTFDRICDLLIAKPRRRCRKIALLVGLGLALLAAGVVAWSCRDRLFPYPVTQVDRQRVGALAGNLLLWTEVFNNLMGKELALVEKARLSIEADDFACYDDGVEMFKHGLVELKKQLTRCEPSPKLMTDLEQMPVDSIGFPVFLERVRQDFSLTDDLLQNLDRAVKYKSIMSKADRLRQVGIEKESIQYRCRIYANGIMGVFCHVSDESIADFKKIAPQWTQLPDLAREWLKDEKEIERVGMSLCGQYEKLIGELSTIVGNLNVSLGQDREKLRGELMANGATADQADKIVREMEKGQLPEGLEMPPLAVPETSEELRENLKKLGASPEQIEKQVAKFEKMLKMRSRDKAHSAAPGRKQRRGFDALHFKKYPGLYLGV